MKIDEYKYLFPFEYIPSKSKILIYGAGLVGQEYFKQIMMTNYCTVVGFIDKEYKNYKSLLSPVYPVEQIRELSYDYVVLAFQTGIHVEVIKRDLIKKAVNVNKIIYMPLRKAVSIEKDNNQIEENFNIDRLAVKKRNLSIAIKLGFALGDNIVRKKVIEEIIRLAPECLIDIYSLAADKFLPSIYENCPNINELIYDGGNLYKRYNEEYSLALTISCLISVDIIKYKEIAMYNRLFAEKMLLLDKKSKQYDSDIDVLSTPFNLAINRHLYAGLNCYSAYNYDGIFNIIDKNVNISCKEILETKVDDCEYITVNYGTGLSMQEISAVSKAWPYDYFNKFIRLFKLKYPYIHIIQVGAAGAKKLKGVDSYFINHPINDVKFILKKSILHLDIEGGLVHLATQLNTKCMVLFGPTQVDYFGYKQNINILAGDCHGCYGLYGDINKCAKHLLKPTCMYSITPEIVMEATNAYFKTIY